MDSKLKHVNITEEEAGVVVIYDECGDTMWDRVLAQHDPGVVSKPDKEKEKD